jgi:hypothetical protein
MPAGFRVMELSLKVVGLVGDSFANLIPSLLLDLSLLVAEAYCF